MSSVRDVLDRLAAGEITLKQAAEDFRTRKWPAQPATTEEQAWGVHDDPAPAEDSWDLVNADSRLTSDQYKVLAEAYTEAISAKS
ncbi:hypothetical protein [Micromonospora costi]|uniref:Uncharacterized protein n=1 Tax=Micromonospora costi TaxID=1530042 RepID=A0A3B0A5M8_9ACTN|nr:hypothetical protein [Micromonospora costi]RKN55935.1 hypothetical protein D7193_15225 [Micromonospora costi]